MKHLKWNALLVGVLALAGAVMLDAAGQASETKGAAGVTQAASQAKPGKKTQPVKTAAARPQSLSGTIASYDAANNTLTVETATGEQTVSVGTNTRIREGSKTLKAAELSGLTGRNVKVRCRESGGKLVADSITVAPAGK